MTKTSGKYGTQRWTHKGYVVEQVGIGYRIWMNFVTPEWRQPRVDTQASVRAIIAFEIGGAS